MAKKYTPEDWAASFKKPCDDIEALQNEVRVFYYKVNANLQTYFNVENLYKTIPQKIYVDLAKPGSDRTIVNIIIPTFTGEVPQEVIDDIIERVNEAKGDDDEK